MTTVHKYVLNIEDKQVIVMPEGAELLRVEPAPNIRYRFWLWARIDTAKRTVPVIIYTHGTGYPMIQPNATYVGTLFMPSDGLVFHVFQHKN